MLVKVKSKKQSHHICLYVSLMKVKKGILEYKVIRNVKYDKSFGTVKKEKYDTFNETDGIYRIIKNYYSIIFKQKKIFQIRGINKLYRFNSYPHS